MPFWHLHRKTLLDSFLAETLPDNYPPLNYEEGISRKTRRNVKDKFSREN